MSTIWLLVYAAIAVVTVSLLLNAVFMRKIVREYEIGVLYTSGRFVRILPSGSHIVLRARNEITVLDGRIQNAAVSGQEILSADNIGIKAGVVASYKIEDVQKALHLVDDYTKALHQSIQLALRTVTSEKTIDELLSGRNEIGEAIMALVAPEAKEIGLNLISLKIRDFIFASDVKKLFTDILKAQKEGVALLERARSESATLRSLANSAKLLEQNPALANLRMLQAIHSASESPGNTLVIGVPPFASVPNGKDAS